MIPTAIFSCGGFGQMSNFLPVAKPARECGHAMQIFAHISVLLAPNLVKKKINITNQCHLARQLATVFFL